MIPGIEIDFGGGRRYMVPPLALGDLELYQDRINAMDAGNLLSPENVKTVLDVAHAALVRNYPDVTRADVGTLIDVGNMLDVWESILDVGGLRRKTRSMGATEGNLTAPASPTLEAGAPSTPE